MIKSSIFVVLATTAYCGMAIAEPLVIESDKTQLVTVSVRPGTVVVGNPSIADVSINGNQIFLHGHGFGNTNILILDTQGKQLANFDVTVKQAESDAVTLFRGPAKYSLACGSTCEYTLQVGDQPDWFKELGQQRGTINSLASGSQSTEAKAPAAPQ